MMAFNRILLFIIIVILELTSKTVSVQLPKCRSENGKIYPVGSVFTDRNCTVKCHCFKDGVICEPMCGITYQQNCLSQIIERKNVTLPDAQGNYCFCPVVVCKPVLSKPIPQIMVNECRNGKKTYKPGEKFISNNCNSQCECQPDGSVTCVSLCSPMITVCAADERKISTFVRVANSNCTCQRFKCVKDRFLLGSGQPPKCRSKSGKLYPVGSVFTDRNCTVKCQCFPDGVRCEPMCKVVKQKNCLHQSIEWKQMATPDAQGNSCYCPIPVCKQNLCYDGGKTYKEGEQFISSTCDGSCKCGPRGRISCVSLCPPRIARCKADEEEVEILQKVAKSTNCTCPTIKCVKRKQEFCKISGKKYKSGEYFVMGNCNGYCRCEVNNGVYGYSCVSLCPPTNIVCSQGKRKVPKDIPAFTGSNCTCSSWECV